MNTPLHFTKMHGLGNDYIYVNCFEQEVSDPASLSQKLSPRHFGIGADGLVLICPPQAASDEGLSNYAAEMRMFNADGSEAQMCGNALRCVAAFLVERSIVSDSSFSILTGGGIKHCSVETENGQVTSVTTTMGVPEFKPAKIPCEWSAEDAFALPVTELLNPLPALAGVESLTFNALATGNPHAVCLVEQILDEHIHQLGPLVEQSERFPERVNVEFVQVLAPDKIRMRVWERGSGETQACGTGAFASVVVTHALGLTSDSVTVQLNGGDLQIFREDGDWYMRGPATIVFDGKVNT